MGRRSLVVALGVLGACRATQQPTDRVCNSSVECPSLTACYSAISLGRASSAGGICSKATFPEWSESQPCWNTSDCRPGKACFADLVWSCEGGRCSERLEGRCFEEAGSHRKCKSDSDCASGEDCGHTHLLMCPDGPTSCFIGLLGQTKWGGRNWGRVGESLCIKHDPKRWVPLF
jgi:hypothetical protein